jgi:hypothetical protein
VGTAMNVIQRLFRHLLKETNLKEDANGVARTFYSLRHTALMFRYMKGEKFDIYTLAQNALTSADMLEKFYLSHGVSENDWRTYLGSDNKKNPFLTWASE